MAGNEGARLPPISTAALITILIAIGTAVLAAFWSLSDPRSELKSIRDGYLSIREHNEFASRAAADIRRIEEENHRQVSIDAFNAWRTEHEKITAEILRKLDGKTGKGEVDEVWKQRRAEIDDLRRQIETLRNAVLQHERDDRAVERARNGNK